MLDDSESVPKSVRTRSRNEYTQARHDSIENNNPQIPNPTLALLKEKALRVVDYGVGFGLWAGEGFGGIADFIRGERNGVRGNISQRAVAAAITAGAIVGGVNAGSNFIEYLQDHSERTPVEQVIEDTRMTQIGTGRDRFQDRRTRIEAFKDIFAGVLSQSTLSKFDYAISNPHDGVQQRSELATQISDLSKLSERYVNSSRTDLETFYKTVAGLVVLENAGLIDDTWRQAGLVKDIDPDDDYLDQYLSDFLNRFDGFKDIVDGGKVPSSAQVAAVQREAHNALQNDNFGR